ncbi:hypothetical protein [Metallosphaera hakonensis]|uniref:Uncharacterized protein n=1 Tax=Metallosphaera hakonensis JCM 8857 = DSM 7519 TaxID=1293036 RepID=A0A2U9IQR1_9CREN|nr:hypothetical protein [Metallosphaera hakonensis]AWR98360.1 hypothetical protein DFR87_00020 [Metallosphaera hakonensis JCM 8857 = DSM 7519]
MRTITVRIPEELYRRMRDHKEMNWSELIRNAIRAELDRIENVSTGVEIVENLKKLGVNERDIGLEPPQGEEEFQRELKRKSTIPMS